MAPLSHAGKLQDEEWRDRARLPLMRRLPGVRLALGAPILVFLILCEQLLPPLPQYLFLSSSMALGTAMAAIVILLICFMNEALSEKRSWCRPLDMNISTLLFVVLVAAVILAHAIVADSFQEWDYGRCLQSLALLILLLGAGITLGRALLIASDRSVEAALRSSFWVMCFILVLHLTNLQPLGGGREKSMFPFAETSHFALALTPVLIYRCVRARRKTQLWWVLGCLATALLVQSVALLAGCLLIAAACRRLLILVVPALLLLIVGLPLGLEYFTSRLNFTGSIVNLSNLVYLEGWQLLFEALQKSHGWGVGFQQLGVQGTQIAVADTIHAIAQGEDLNLLDGSFVFAKLGAEFGVFGLLLTVAYVATAARSLMILRRGCVGPAMTFAHCVVVAYGVDMFVRGTGYFVQSSMLFVCGLNILLLGHKAGMTLHAATGHGADAREKRKVAGPLGEGPEGLQA